MALPSQTLGFPRQAHENLPERWSSPSQAGIWKPQAHSVEHIDKE